MRPLVNAAFVALLALSGLSSADEHTHKYEQNEQVILWMNTVGPYHNRQETYKFFSLPICQGSHTKVGHYHETMAEALQGVELQNSGYNIKFGVNEKQDACSSTLTVSDAKKLVYAITNNYWSQMYLDDLPIMSVLGMYENPQGTSAKTNKPTPEAKFYVWTHKKFEIGYNKDRIVVVNTTNDGRVEVYPGQTLTFSYEVTWVPSDVVFDERFDKYLDKAFFQHKIHWFSIFNSFMMVIFLVGLVFMILMRTLRKDFARYSREDDLDDIERDLVDEYGWKQVHADVFRLPKHATMLATLVGTGTHIFLCSLCSILAAMWGDMYEERGQTLSTIIFLFAATSVVGGYVGGALYLQFGGKNWIRQMLVQTCFFPAIVFAANFYINFIAVTYSSSRAIPLDVVFKISAIVIFAILPLTLGGCILGRNTTGVLGWPCRVNPVPRPIPENQWYMDPISIALIGGVLPFGSIFIEMYFVFTSFWAYKIYYVYGFMLLVFCILTIVTICVNIVCVYFLLNSEDYRWWWPSFCAGASTGIYVFGYAIYYFVFKTKMSGFFQTAIYFSQSAVLCIGLGICTGALGFLGSFLFVRKIYQNIKID
eukprot:CFRG4868T1